MKNNETNLENINRKLLDAKNLLNDLENHKTEILRQEKIKLHEQLRQERDTFKMKLEEDHGLTNRLSDNILKDIFDYAWGVGHPEGYNQVAIEYSKLVDGVIDPMLKDFGGYLKKLTDT